jgi:pimeloyl-ACP methyl ester carboxylesterase
VAAAQDAGLRLISYDRLGYGGSSPQPGRTMADTAADVAAVTLTKEDAA